MSLRAFLVIANLIAIIVIVAIVIGFSAGWSCIGGGA